MGRRTAEIQDDILVRLKADLAKTLAEYEKASDLRSKKMLHETEQIKTYLQLLETKSDNIELKGRGIKKLNRLLTWEVDSRKKDLPHRKRQDKLEDHFLEIQKTLVDLLSQRFKY